MALVGVQRAAVDGVSHAIDVDVRTATEALIATGRPTALTRSTSPYLARAAFALESIHGDSDELHVRAALR